ncbi:MAG: nuclear transport factor 2 family protein [Deltaproteobacteria bacterium]|nr:nuclear transport factor 2 family protein [Nannocystaceae bacterium]
MSTSTDPISTVVMGRVAAVRAKDRDALLAAYADDVVTFDVVPPMRNVGVKAVAAKLGSWLDGYRDDLACEITELDSAASGDVGFAHGFCHFTGTLKKGATVDMWVRLTVGLRKRGDRWLITHEHQSDPLDPETGKALTDLRPE